MNVQMMRWSFFLVAIILQKSSTYILECEFENSYWPVLDETYSCIVKNKNIPQRNEFPLNKVDGKHKELMSNNDVKVIVMTLLSIDELPLGMENFFRNIEGIAALEMHLKEIHQNNLKRFPSLRLLELEGNEIITIEKDLFKYNPKLEYVNFEKNPIIHIEPNVFDHLSSLTLVYINYKLCSNEMTHFQSANIDRILNQINQGGCRNENHNEILNFRKNFIEKYEFIRHYSENVGTELASNGDEVRKLKNEILKLKSENEVKSLEMETYKVRSERLNKVLQNNCQNLE